MTGSVIRVIPREACCVLCDGAGRVSGCVGMDEDWRFSAVVAVFMQPVTCPMCRGSGRLTVIEDEDVA